MKFRIGERLVGEGQPVFIVAELSANHLQNFDLAVKTIEAAREAGADAIKLQTFLPDTLTIDCDNKYFRIKKGTPWDNKTLYKLYREAYTPWEWQPELKKIAEELGIICFSSPFDRKAVDFLEEMKIPAYKIASFEITDIPLIEYVASKGKPVILSTGIATLAEIEEAISTCRKAGNTKIALLKCTSAYPASPEEINLKMINDFISRFQAVAGLSDHTTTISVPVGAVALGAKIVEKHFILSRKIGGPDASFSAEPEEFKAMVKAIREVEKALGRIDYSLTRTAKKNRLFARSIFVVKDMEKGDIFTEENVRSIRPGHGLSPKHLPYVLGKKARKAIKKGTPLSFDLIED